MTIGRRSEPLDKPLVSSCLSWLSALREIVGKCTDFLKGRVPPFLHKVVLRRANQPHNSHEDRFSMLWPSRIQSPPKSQITMVKVSGKHIWWHQICLPDTLTIVIWLLGGDCVRLGQSIEKRSSWELWGWFALLKTTLCKKGGTLPLSNALSRIQVNKCSFTKHAHTYRTPESKHLSMLKYNNVWCSSQAYVDWLFNAMHSDFGDHRAIVI